MTLGLIFASPEYVGVVIEGSLAGDPDITTNAHTKCGLVAFEQGSYVWGFSGIAYVKDQLTTSMFLQETFVAAASGSASVIATLDRVAELLTVKMRSLRRVELRAKALSVVFAGYELNPLTGGVFRAFHSVSNFEEFDDAPIKRTRVEPIFSRSSRRYELNGGTVLAIGQHIRGESLSPMMDHMRSGHPARAAVDECVGIIRAEAASNPLIGKECMSLTMARSGGDASAEFHPSEATSIAYIPANVYARDDGGLVIFGGSWSSFEPTPGDVMIPRGATQSDPDPAKIVATPRVRPKQPCPCGSGRKYRYCHGGR